MNNDQYFDEEMYQNAMQEENIENEMLYDTFQEECFDETMYKKSSLVAVTLDEAKIGMMIEESGELYIHLFSFMQENKPFLSLSIGIQEGLPYYQTELHKTRIKIFITNEIYKQIHNYLKYGTTPDKFPDVDNVYKNMDENFILRHFKADNANNVTTYSDTTKEYKAKYNHGIINYGQLPYTKEELKAKLNSLQ
jgi:hypothetical protein